MENGLTVLSESVLLCQRWIVLVLDHYVGSFHTTSTYSSTSSTLQHIKQPDESSAEVTLLSLFAARCRQQCKAPRVGGEELDDTVTAVFSSLLWHTQTLREEVDKMDFSKYDFQRPTLRCSQNDKQIWDTII